LDRRGPDGGREGLNRQKRETSGTRWMYDAMQGVRVVEGAEHTFAPAAGMLLAALGAAMIKVERSQGGDTMRNLSQLRKPGHKLNQYIEVSNRGKRSIGLNLNTPEGREQLYALIDKADVFITNLRREPRTKLGILPEDLMPRNPRLIYA